MPSNNPVFPGEYLNHDAADAILNPYVQRQRSSTPACPSAANPNSPRALEGTVNKPALWTAETPNLYTLVLILCNGEAAR